MNEIIESKTNEALGKDELLTPKTENLKIDGTMPNYSDNTDCEDNNIEAPKVSLEKKGIEKAAAENVEHENAEIESNELKNNEHLIAENEKLPENKSSDESENERINSEDVNLNESTTIETAPTETEQKNTPEKVKPLSNEQVTEHTSALWKYNPIPENEPEPFPEYLTSFKQYPKSTVVGARVRGKKHKHEGTNCDDWFETANFEDITFVAVSDGAGSKKFSRVGARASCKAAVGFLVNAFEELYTENSGIREDLKLGLSDGKCMEACRVLAEKVRSSVIKAYEAVETAFYMRKTDSAYEKVLGRSLKISDLSGTLLIAVIIPTGEAKENLVISCQIGDGAIAILDTRGGYENSLKLMGIPDGGDFSGETDFLTSPKTRTEEALKSRTKIAVTSADMLFVMTDGVADDYFPNETEMHRLYLDLLINGIIGENKLPTEFTQEQMKMFKRIPDPLVYPWVNDKNVKVPVQYTKRIAEALGLSLEDIFTDRTTAYLASLEIKYGENVSQEEKLKIWLDNYVERGSFDDRTLVVVSI